MLVACSLAPNAASANGALALGSSGNLAKDGFAFGASVNQSTQQAASDQALATCRGYAGAPKMAAICKIIMTFSEQCYALVFDPKAGMPGTGWALGADVKAAVQKATSMCQSTAGASRRNFCELDQAACDFKDLDKKISGLDELIRLLPRYASNWRNRGGAYEGKGNYDRAIADYSEAIRLAPDNAGYLNDRCWVRAVGNRDLQLALDDCTESLRLKPDDAGTIDSRGFVYLRLGRLDDAIADYNAALRLNARLAGALYGRGLAKLRKGDTSGGEADIAAAKAIRSGVVEEFARYGVTAVAAAPAPVTAPPSAADCSRAEAHWKSAEDIRTLPVYEDHLARFGSCEFAVLARARIETLKK